MRHAALWNEARTPARTLAEAYLRHEGITCLPADAGRFLRFHPACPFGKERAPAMLVLIRSIATGKPRAIERTSLTADGRREGRMTLGPKADGIVMVSADEEVEAALALCEGVKDALALLQAGFWWPVWATLGTSGMGMFPLLEGIDALTIVADRDDAGMKAAQQLGQRWADASRHVEIRHAPGWGQDPADFLTGEVQP